MHLTPVERRKRRKTVSCLSDASHKKTPILSGSFLTMLSWSARDQRVASNPITGLHSSLQGTSCKSASRFFLMSIIMADKDEINVLNVNSPSLRIQKILTIPPRLFLSDCLALPQAHWDTPFSDRRCR
eukprot:3526521-Amphidinium_carterae.1